MSMPQDAVESTAKIPVGPLSPARRKGVTRRRLGLGDLDGRSLEARRARQIARELEAGFAGQVTPVQHQAIERAALMVVLAEDLAARRLAGEAIPIVEVLRAEGVAKRAVAAIVAAQPIKPEPLSPGPRAIAAEKESTA
jgi:hypothetical protein